LISASWVARITGLEALFLKKKNIYICHIDGLKVKCRAGDVIAECLSSICKPWVQSLAPQQINKMHLNSVSKIKRKFK
jgi:hypothetical protein